MTGSIAYFARAREPIASAELLLEGGDFGSSASRSYYAMFLAPEALLMTAGLHPHTHKGTLGMVGRHFVRTGKLSRAQERSLRKAFELRQRGDYEVEEPVGRDEAEGILRAAREFVDAAERIVETPPTA
jgi:uncharacterized protein (UPF0332 family)